MVAIDSFSVVEIRLIQSLWTTKSVQYIANMLDRPIAVVERKIQEMNRTHRAELFKPVTFTRKIKQKEVEWAKKQLAEPAPIKIQDNRAKVSVRINAKTTVFVYPEDVEKTKKKYGIK